MDVSTELSANEMCVNLVNFFSGPNTNCPKRKLSANDENSCARRANLIKLLNAHVEVATAQVEHLQRAHVLELLEAHSERVAAQIEIDELLQIAHLRHRRQQVVGEADKLE